MRTSKGGALCVLGLVVLVHTTISVIQYRQMLKLAQEEYSSLPPSILAELGAGLIIALLGGFLMSGPLKVITMPSKGRSMDLGSLRHEFISFNTRSKALPLDIPPIT